MLRKRRFRAHTACCNNKTMDVTRQVCCEGRIRSSTEGTYKVFAPTCSMLLGTMVLSLDS